jgi:hypothetical protein
MKTFKNRANDIESETYEVRKWRETGSAYGQLIEEILGHILRGLNQRLSSINSLSNLMGAVLEKTYYQWAGERYISKDSLTEVLNDPALPPPLEPLPGRLAAAAGSNSSSEKSKAA